LLNISGDIQGASLSKTLSNTHTLLHTHNQAPEFGTADGPVRQGGREALTNGRK